MLSTVDGEVVREDAISSVCRVDTINGSIGSRVITFCRSLLGFYFFPTHSKTRES